MRRRLPAALLALCLALTLLPGKAAAANSGSCGDGLTFQISYSGTLTISGKGAMDDYTSGIYAPWGHSREIKRVVINQGTTRIGNYAFYNCPNLEEISIPSSVTAIGQSAFENCTGLTSVTLPDSITQMGESVFSGCTMLASVRLPSGLKTLPSGAFRKCAGLTSVTVPDGVTDIGSGAFSECSALTSVSLPKSLETLDAHAFSECTSLASVDIPPCVETVGRAAFYNCASLTSMILPAHLTSIPEYAFNGCSSLESVELPHFIYSVEAGTAGAFGGCTALKTVRYRGTEEELKDKGSRVTGAFADTVTFECLPENHFHTVTFHGYYADGVENLPQPITVLYQRSISKPAQDPTLTGYRFTGWYRSPDDAKFNTNKYGFSTPVWEDITLYAGWDPIKYTVKFHGNKNDYWYNEQESTPNPYSKKVEHGAVVWELDILPTRGDDYTLTGWYTEPECQNKWDLKKDPVTGDITLYAGWKSNIPPTYTVTFDSQGGSAVSSQTIQEKGTVKKPAVPSWTGHTFGGWYKEASCTTPWNFDTDTVTGDLTLYAKWTLSLCCVRYTWSVNGGIHTFCEQTVQYNSKTTAPDPAPQRTGHTFGGWYRDENCQQPWDFGNDTVTGNLTLYAKWTVQSFRVAFDLNGGGPAGSFQDQEVPYGGKVAAPAADPTYTGHAFEGWYKEASCTTPWNFDTDTVTGDLILYAGWRYIPPTYTVTFDSRGGSAVSSQTIQENGVVPKPADPTYTGHTFEGWYKEASCTTRWNFDTDTVTSNLTLYAKWTVQSFRVTFFLNGGGPAASFPDISVAYGQKIPAPTTAPSWTGHTFEGWYKEASCTTRWNFATDTVTGDITLYAKWTEDPPAPGNHTVTFDSQGGSEVSPQSVTSGGKATEPADPTYAGHTFGGWYKEASCTTPWDFDTDTVTGDVTLYAKWTAAPKTYTITLDPNGGALPAGQSATLTTGADGKLAALPADPVRPGYTFGGWFTQQTGGTAVTTATVFTENTTVYARWTAAAGTYYRIYAPDRVPGGSLYVSHTLALAGTRVTVEPAPRRGYELDWLTVTDLSSGRELRLWEYGADEYTFTMPAADVEVEIAFSLKNTGGSSGGSSGGSRPAPAPAPAGRTPVRWYYSGGAIYHVVDGRVTDGTWLTRDMLISVLYNLDDTSSGEPEFWATSRQVIPDIYKSWLWGADKAISREQAAVILFSYARYKNYNNFERADLSGYTDRDLILPIAQPAVSWARATGLIAGTSARTLSPKGCLTARQGGVIVARFVGDLTA